MLLDKIREFDIPVVETILPFTNVDSLVTFTRGLENVEGFVVAFDDGHRVKIKADQYVRIHKTVDRIVFDRNIVDLIINEEVDDVVPMLPQAQADRVRDFERRFWQAFNETEAGIAELYIDAARYENRKDVATVFVKTVDKSVMPFIFRMLDGHDLRELMLDHVRKSISSNTKWEQTAAWLGM